jgi:hypothetical protein
MTDQSGQPLAPKESGGGPEAPYWAPRDVQADSMPRQWRSGRELALRCTAEVPGVTTTCPIQAIPRGTIAMQTSSSVVKLSGVITMTCKTLIIAISI